MISSLAAAAEAAHEFCFDCPAPTSWEDVAIFLTFGVISLPVALLVVWLLHLARLERWILLNTALAAIASLIVSVLLDIFNVLNTYHVVEAILQVSVPIGSPAITSTLLFGILGSAALGLWLKRRSQQVCEVSPEFSE